MAKKKARPKGVVPPPKCKAILLCDRVIVDALTGHYSAINIFDTFFLRSFPGRTRPFTAYVQLTDGIGSYAITLEIRDLNDDSLVAASGGQTIVFSDRAVKAHMIILASPAPLTQEGLYDFVVLANGQEIDRQKFLATTFEEMSDEKDEAEDPGEG